MLTIVSVAYPLAAVSEDAVGGAEQILAALDAAITAAGHRSIVIAPENSRVRGELRPIPVLAPPYGDAQRDAAQSCVRQCLAECHAQASLIHLHGIDAAAYLPAPGPPALITLHLPPAWYPPEAAQHTRPRTWFNCVSATQDAAAANFPNRLPPIANGVDAESLGAARHARRNYALTLGRICPEKNQHDAADAAALANLPLLIGGQVFPYAAHQRYFDTQIQPRLNQRCRFLGPLALARKRRLLAGATCLLSTSQAPETSSLVAMEALACGTPVIAYPSGALPEIIEHGRTGFLVSSVAEMAAAMGNARQIDPAQCRAAARTRFSRDRMCQQYLQAYERLAL